jgi:hypothetical protein
MVLPKMTTAPTNYNPKAIKNVKVIFRRKDQENRWKVTEEERAYAKKCKYPKDLHDFTKAVCFPSSGRNWLRLNNLMTSSKNN